LPVDVLVVPSVQAVVLGVFCTPPWPLQVPLPVEVLVVPSLHVLGASSARLDGASANTANGNAINAERMVVFINDTPLW
jgi:hypothetical protein